MKENNQAGLTEVRLFLKAAFEVFQRHPFRPHPIFSGAHAQTLAAYAWPRPYRLHKTPVDQERLFEVAPGIKVLANCRWQVNPQSHSTLVIWHGMEGSTNSVYMIAMADKGFRAGFNIVRVNYRNCGGTEHLSPTLYHGGMSEDLRAVIEELINRDGLEHIFPIGFSLGGNLVLKLAGEYGDAPPRQIIAACAVSPSVDLRASTDLILERRNWLYHRNFVRSLKQRMELKHRLFPDLYNIENLSSVETIRDFDERFTSLANGFANADDYYYRSSSLRVVEKIRIPTLIVHAMDDPFIPFEPLREPSFTENPYLLIIATEKGGHVAFISESAEGDPDRFWAENRTLEFCKLAAQELA